MSRRTVRLAALLPLAALALAGCAGTPLSRSLAVQPSVAQLAACRGEEADYVYYPDFEVYYSRNYGQYVFHYNYAWLVQTAPPDLPPGTLESARAVPMNFHDDPRWHHAKVVREFPRNQARPRATLAAFN